MVNNIDFQSQILTVFRIITIIEPEKCYTVSDYYQKLWELTKLKKSENTKGLFEKKRRYLLLELDRNNKSDFSISNSLQILIKSVQSKTIDAIKSKNMPNFCPMESLVFYYMLNVSLNWAYSDISIMEMYKIVNCYAERFEIKSPEHSNRYCCPCQEIFTKDGCKTCNTMSNEQVQCSIIEHYKTLGDVDRLFLNVNNCIEKLILTSKITYNIFHYVSYTGKNSSFQFGNQFTLIANSNDHVIVFTIKPQLNILNLKSIVCGTMCETIILKDAFGCNNEQRFMNKKIVHCILTFNSTEPFIYEIDSSITDKVIKECIVDRLFCDYSGHHRLVFDFYMYWKNNKPNDINSISHIITKFGDYIKLPIYLVDYFKGIKTKVDECKKNRELINAVLCSVNDYESFKKGIDIKLKTELDEYFGTHDENEFCDF
jgi:hypothetical protein